MMRLAIYGRHPLLHPGFNSTMSFYEAAGFSALGYDVTVIYPETSKYRADSADAPVFDSLCKTYFGKAGVRFVTLQDFAAATDRYDIGIWQSYAPDEQEIHKSFRRRVDRLTKNFPRFFSGEPVDQKRLDYVASEYDLVAFALKEDLDALQSVSVPPEKRNRLHYIGRGPVRICSAGRSSIRSPRSSSICRPSRSMAQETCR